MTFDQLELMDKKRKKDASFSHNGTVSSPTLTLRDNKFENIPPLTIDNHNALFGQSRARIWNERRQAWNRLDEERTKAVSDGSVADHRSDDESNAPGLAGENRRAQVT